MPRFAANLDWLFTEVSFLERFEAAAVAGFRGVEFLFPYSYPAESIAERLTDCGLESVMFNLPPGNWVAGERGIAALQGRESEFRLSLDLALRYARVCRTQRLHVMSGIVREQSDWLRYRGTYIRNLRFAAPRAFDCGVTLLVEAINPFDMPGYLVSSQASAFEICELAGQPNVKMQLDMYHIQRCGEDLISAFDRYRGLCGHVQIAGESGRHEPEVGSSSTYRRALQLLDDHGYAGWVGCEYQPRGTTLDGLQWLSCLG
jgi:hydroxypyruvate isomerase